MLGSWVLVFSFLVVTSNASLLTFPPEFKFGAATAAYQVEGAWNASDKSENVWDVFTHKQRDKISDSTDGDVACDSYHQWRRDIEMAQELGLDFYRFSISWTRLCPGAFCQSVSEDGAAYYDNIINALLEKGIEPVVTLYHWDLPQRLQDLGGWANPLLVKWFEAYARVVFSLYADRVKTWITLNEPLIMCDGVFNGIIAPVINDPQVGAYLCTKTALLAHATAWRIYDKEFRPRHRGRISLCNHLIWYEPKNEGDEALAELAMQNSAGRYSHAIFSEKGGWPPSLQALIARNSKEEGYTRSRLPAFTTEEIELIKGTFDFYGVNFYTSRVVRRAKPGEEIGGWPMMGSADLGVVLESRPDWKDTPSWWFKQNPKGLRNHLVWLKEQYGDIPFLITENGVPSFGGLDDDDRIEYFRDHLRQVLLAMNKDGVNVTGYTAWSLMDNFEWRDGYSRKFGLYQVNFTDPLRTRTPRASASYYAQIIDTHELAPIEDARSFVVWIALGAVLVFLLVVICGFKYHKYRTKDKRVAKYASVRISNGQDFKMNEYK